MSLSVSFRHSARAEFIILLLDLPITVDWTGRSIHYTYRRSLLNSGQ